MITRYWRSGGLGAAAALAVLGLAACGGGGSPRVANLGNSGGSGGSTTTTLPKGNPTQLLDEWAACMRANGDPTQADPTIDANKVIHITFSPAANQTPPRGGQGGGLTTNGGPGGKDGIGGGPCGAYLTAASTALRGGKPPQKPDPAKLEKFSQCMRANGIPDFPDPSGQGLQLRSGPGSDLDPNNPTFRAASKTCAKKAGVPGLGGGSPQPGSIEATSGGPGVGGPGSGQGSGAVVQGG